MVQLAKNGTIQAVDLNDWLVKLAWAYAYQQNDFRALSMLQNVPSEYYREELPTRGQADTLLGISAVGLGDWLIQKNLVDETMQDEYPAMGLNPGFGRA